MKAADKDGNIVDDRKQITDDDADDDDDDVDDDVDVADTGQKSAEKRVICFFGSNLSRRISVEMWPYFFLNDTRGRFNKTLSSL